MGPSETINRLRDDGYEVRVSHRRPTTSWNLDSDVLLTKQEAKDQGHKLAPKGGVTHVMIAKSDDKWHGASRCSRLDNFNRRMGLQIALGRAMKQMGGTVEG